MEKNTDLFKGYVHPHSSYVVFIITKLLTYRMFRSAHEPKRTRVVHYSGLFWGVEGAGDPAQALDPVRQALYC